MKAYFKDLFLGTKSLADGMIVTIKAFFSPPVTIEYPREKNYIAPAFRGHIRVAINEKTGKNKCIACGMCARSCPSSCIKVTSGKKEGEKKKSLTGFSLDFTKCSLCGICVESCPTGAIEYSDEYRLAGFTKEEFHFDLLEASEEDSC
ncbi:MAG: NADH-quinone oxidoreductase subunit I [Deltaproteobacteria bacterium]|nr:MAG: NADH-quinone oxidoreductase subunit I [Deltaproteobacteria bacterium]